MESLLLLYRSLNNKCCYKNDHEGDEVDVWDTKQQECFSKLDCGLGAHDGGRAAAQAIQYHSSVPRRVPARREDRPNVESRSTRTAPQTSQAPSNRCADSRIHQIQQDIIANDSGSSFRHAPVHLEWLIHSILHLSNRPPLDVRTLRRRDSYRVRSHQKPSPLASLCFWRASAGKTSCFRSGARFGIIADYGSSFVVQHETFSIHSTLAFLSKSPRSTAVYRESWRRRSRNFWPLRERSRNWL